MVNLLRLVVLVAALLAGAMTNVMAGDDAFNPCGPPACIPGVTPGCPGF
jgi:hypothetical protein